MGTKLNPGKFDCYANAAPDEPMFILLGRDERAPAAVRSWAAAYKESKTSNPGAATAAEHSTKYAEALEVADAMDHYRTQRGAAADAPEPKRRLGYAFHIVGTGQIGHAVDVWMDGVKLRGVRGITTRQFVGELKNVTLELIAESIDNAAPRV